MTGQSRMPFMASSHPELLGDCIYTPTAVTDALLDSGMAPPLGPVIDPYAGNGAILHRLFSRGWAKKDLFACEIREEEEAALADVAHCHVMTGNWHKVRCDIPGPGNGRRYACPECIDHFHQMEPCECCGRLDRSTIPAVDHDAAWVGERSKSTWRGWPASVVVTNPPYGQLPEAAFSALSPDLPGHLRYCALLMPVEELAGVRRCLEFLAKYPPTGMVHIHWRPFPGSRGVAWYVWQRGIPTLRMEWR